MSSFTEPLLFFIEIDFYWNLNGHCFSRVYHRVLPLDEEKNVFPFFLSFLNFFSFLGSTQADDVIGADVGRFKTPDQATSFIGSLARLSPRRRLADVIDDV